MVVQLLFKHITLKLEGEKKNQRRWHWVASKPQAPSQLPDSQRHSGTCSLVTSLADIVLTHIRLLGQPLGRMCLIKKMTLVASQKSCHLPGGEVAFSKFC